VTPKHLEPYILQEPQTYRQVVEKINTTGLGFVIIVNRTGQLVGTITDGDIRRLYLRSVNPDSELQWPSQRQVKTVTLNASQETVFDEIREGVRFLPVLNDQGVVVDVAGLDQSRRIPNAKPSIGSAEAANVLECLRTGWLSSQGPYILEFESKFAQLTESYGALAVSNGTVAIQLALSCLGIGPGDEVFVPNLTFAASINAVLAVGATPRLVDIDEKTWTIDPEALRMSITSQSRAILPVHLYGQPVDCDVINDIANEHNLVVVGDAAEALGATYKGRPIGSQFDISTFSFFANKQITTGEGGMITVSNQEQLELARILRDHGMSPKRKYWHEHAGYNFRMTNIQAAIGVAQMGRFEEIQARRTTIFGIYDSALGDSKILNLLPRNEWSTNSKWLYTLRLLSDSPNARDRLISEMSNKGFEIRTGFFPLHEMPPYRRYSFGAYAISTMIANQLICLPTYPDLEDEVAWQLATLLRSLAESLSSRA
jgi:perosamine synthetase